MDIVDFVDVVDTQQSDYKVVIAHTGVCLLLVIVSTGAAVFARRTLDV